MKYKVGIRQVYREFHLVEADSEKEAIDKAREELQKGSEFDSSVPTCYEYTLNSNRWTIEEQ